MADPDIDDIERRMNGALEMLKKEFGGLRTGRASASLLEPIVVEAYGSPTPLNQVANINVPEPRMLTVQVWDKTMVQSVEKAIRNSGLGLNPATDGQLIRLPIPELNEERRQELSKIAGKYAEEGRISVRNVRRHGMDELKKMEKDGDISQDEHHMWQVFEGIRDDLPPPVHVAIIMDGNGRWAKARGLPRVAGHKRGAEAVRTAVESCKSIGIKYLTLYAFSSENWKRPATEVDDLMGLLRHYLSREIKQLDKSGVRLRCIGEREGLAKDIIRLIEDAEEKTRHNNELTLQIAVNYGGQNEILNACRSIAREVADGKLTVDDIDDETFTSHLHTAGVPDPDLLIRTSGEKRLSNFLLWQSAYAELVFVDTLWPDFTKDELIRVIDEFHSRDRRYGNSSG